MKHAALIGLAILAGCSQSPPTTSGVPARAIYLVQGQGQLSQQDLLAHPEVAVTNSFDALKALARSKTALWIDVNAAGLVDTHWLAQKPQSRYPIALVGDGSELCSFRETLIYFTFEDVPGYQCDPPPPGFSVSMQASDTGGWWHGYQETPTAEKILNITDALLDGRRP